jgi:putative restriction endonuclease
MIELINTSSLFDLTPESTVSKRNFFDLIQFSKKTESEYWTGENNVINNTPQQGINWIGSFPNLSGLILKVKEGSYLEDGWINDQLNSYRYSFKASKGEINYESKANLAITNQVKFQYPILLFIESKQDKSKWIFKGFFKVHEIEERSVILNLENYNSAPDSYSNELFFEEGKIKYVTHLTRERSKEAVNFMKSKKPWICDICSSNFKDIYEYDYIEVHHKVPISKTNVNRKVSPKDFALLCPNCHNAVHIFMKKQNLDYHEIKKILSNNF